MVRTKGSGGSRSRPSITVSTLFIALGGNGTTQLLKQFRHAAQMLLAHRIENVFLFHVVLLHHDQQGFGIARVVFGIARGQGILGSGEQLAHLRMLGAHHLGRPRAHAGAFFESRKEDRFLGGKMPLHGLLEAGKRLAGVVPGRRSDGLLGGDETVVAAAMVVGHQFSECAH